MPSNIIMDMTWEEFRCRADTDPVVVIPMGSVELEGPHLPLGTDTIVAEEIVRQLTREEGILLAPTVNVGYSKWFKPFPGTISFEHDTLTRVLLDCCRCLFDHGISRFVFLNAHKGNNCCVEDTARSMISEKQIKIGMLSIWKLANDLIQGKGLIDEGRFTHAGEIMTSVVMAVRPETVKTEKIKADKAKSPEGSPFKVKNSLGETDFMGSVQTVFQDIRKVTDTGILGDPQTASAEKGRQIMDMIVSYSKAYLQEFRKLK